MSRSLALALWAAMLLNCAHGPSGEAPAKSSPESAWLDTVEQRYEATYKPQILASWQRRVGEKPQDTSAAEAAEREFFRDAALRQRLEALSTNADPSIANRARSWLRFIDRNWVSADDEIAKLTEQIENVALGGDGDESGQSSMLTWFQGTDPAARQAAVLDMQDRTRRLIPLLVARAKRLDQVAKAMGKPDGLTALAGPNALGRLEADCREQLSKTEPAWRSLLARETRQLGRRPTLADYFAMVAAWTGETGSFLKADQFPRLAKDALSRMGMDLDAMHIDIKENLKTAGGAAYAISIPDDVRFAGNFPSGYNGARGYFHELGHAVHMKLVKPKHLPDRALPADRALNEAIGEIFGDIIRDPSFIRARFPLLGEDRVAAYREGVRALDAAGQRLNCLHARFEAEIHAGRDIVARWPALYEETMGEKPAFEPTYVMLVYLSSPLYTRDYVLLEKVKDAFFNRLRDQPLLSKEGGDFLRETLLEPGNSLSLEGYLADPTDFPAWKARKGQ